jgi:hypothetical protein
VSPPFLGVPQIWRSRSGYKSKYVSFCDQLVCSRLLAELHLTPIECPRFLSYIACPIFGTWESKVKRFDSDEGGRGRAKMSRRHSELQVSSSTPPQRARDAPVLQGGTGPLVTPRHRRRGAQRERERASERARGERERERQTDRPTDTHTHTHTHKDNTRPAVDRTTTCRRPSARAGMATWRSRRSGWSMRTAC